MNHMDEEQKKKLKSTLMTTIILGILLFFIWYLAAVHTDMEYRFILDQCPSWAHVNFSTFNVSPLFAP